MYNFTKITIMLKNSTFIEFMLFIVEILKVIILKVVMKVEQEDHVLKRWFL